MPLDSVQSNLGNIFYVDNPKKMFPIKLSAPEKLNMDKKLVEKTVSWHDNKIEQYYQFMVKGRQCEKEEHRMHLASAMLTDTERTFVYTK